MAFVSNFFEPVLLHHFGLMLPAVDLSSMGIFYRIGNVGVEVWGLEENIRELERAEITAAVASLSLGRIRNPSCFLVLATVTGHKFYGSRAGSICEKSRRHRFGFS